MKINSYADFCAWRAATLDAEPYTTRLIAVLTDDEAVALFRDLSSHLENDPNAGPHYREAKRSLMGGVTGPAIGMIHDAMLQDVRLQCTRRCLDAA